MWNSELLVIGAGHGRISETSFPWQSFLKRKGLAGLKGKKLEDMSALQAEKRIEIQKEECFRNSDW